ncbi:MAG: hypothetical protein GY705_05205 [Bacteroidetes bacterium]|nr:hypothetical protein [Bacteroidota bacterium]
MRNLQLLFILFLSALLLSSNCEIDNPFDPDDPNDPPDPEEVFKSSIDTSILVQEDYLGKFSDYLSTMDTVSAKAQLLIEIQNDPYVDMAQASPQGIGIEFKNGRAGFLLLNSYSDKIIQAPPPIIEIQPRDPVLPASKCAMFIDTRFTELNKYGDKILEAHQRNLIKTEFGPPGIYYGKEANVDLFANLTGCGVIQIYSHGVYPFGDKVYLMTGEQAIRGNYATALAYQNDMEASVQNLMLISHKVPKSVAIGNDTIVSVYGVSAEFVNKYNDFTADSTLMIGGFCYSGIGGWPNKMVNAGALGYLGFDWVLRADLDLDWTNDLLTKLCDTLMAEPYTAGQWFNEKARWHNYPSRFGSDPNNRTDVVYKGSNDLALWFKEELEILRIEVSFFIGDATFVFNYYDGSPSVTGYGGHAKVFTSVNGTSTFVNNRYSTTFDRTFLGQTYTGNMEVNLTPFSVNVQADETKKYSVNTVHYTMSLNNVAFDPAESSETVKVYQSKGSSLNSISTSYTFTTPNYQEVMTNYNIAGDDYVRVSVFYH